MKKRVLRSLVLAGVCTQFIGVTKATANSLDWSGKYRIEWLELNNPKLDDDKHRKSYLLHHMVLSPKIVAADGVTLHLRMDILNDTGAYANSQLGQFMGQGPGTTTPTDSTNSSVVANQEKSDTIAVNEAYLTWFHEYGVLIAGRAPLHFGLGMSYNSGAGEFDHWLTNRDMVGFKIKSDNLTLLPAIGKMKEGLLSQEDDINDIIFMMNYDNSETGLKMGMVYQNRIATPSANDAPAVTMGGTGALTDGRWNSQHINLFVAKQKPVYDFGMEVGFVNGKTGINTTSDTDIKLEGFGVAVEYEYHPEKEKWLYGVKAGIASGADSTNLTKYEGFQFNPNYEVAMLLFNHPLGKADFLGSKLNRSGSPSDRADDEVISNVQYLSPSARYLSSDKTYWEFRATFAQLARETLPNIGMSKNLGYEFDTSLVTKPYEKFTWVMQLGLLFPGAGFQGGSNDYTAGFAYGFTTKAAISF